MAFAQERDLQDKGLSISNKPKKKGNKELQGVKCSINYDKVRSQPESKLQLNKGDKRTQGEASNFLCRSFLGMLSLWSAEHRLIVKEVLRNNKVQVSLIQ